MKQLFYTLCVFLLCIIDQRKGSVTGEMQLFWSNCTGLVIALLIFSHYRFRDFLKIRYLVWIVIAGAGLAVCMIKLPGNGLPGNGLPWAPVQWYSAYANIFVYGLLLIRTIADMRGRTFQWKNLLFPGLLCLMLLLMGISRNDSLWPWYFLMVFGTFALTDFTEKERRCLGFALGDGILVGFFCIQGLAFVFRPYDILRYMGMYANPNINALFYSLVYCAFLVRLLYVLFEVTGKIKFFLVPILLFFSGAMWPFVLLTGCRTALMSMAVVTCVAGIYCMTRFRKWMICKALGLVVGLLLCMVSSFTLVFWCVRYIPAYFHHPIWFHTEYSEYKVHSWDPMDSEKYIDFDEMLEYVLERMLGIELPEENAAVITEPEVRFALLCSASPEMLGSTEEMPLSSDATGSVVVRSLIYEYYLLNLNMTGHLNEENGVYVTEMYFAPHAHNLYIQQAFDFGIPIGILFLVYVVVCIVRLIKSVAESKSAFAVGLLLLFVNGCVFGILEMMWTNGYLAFTILFLAPLIPGRKPEAGIEVESE